MNTLKASSLLWPPRADGEPVSGMGLIRDRKARRVGAGVLPKADSVRLIHTPQHEQPRESLQPGWPRPTLADELFLEPAGKDVILRTQAGSLQPIGPRRGILSSPINRTTARETQCKTTGEIRAGKR